MTDLIGDYLEAFPRHDAAGFFDWFRQREDGFESLRGEFDVTRDFFRAADLVHSLGTRFPALGLAVENHLMACAVVASFPLESHDPLRVPLERLKRRLRGVRPYVANTASYVHSGKPRTIGTCMIRESGHYLLRGKAAFVSLASHADCLIVASRTTEGLPIGAILHGVREDARVRYGDVVFPVGMLDSDTKSVEFLDLEVPFDQVLEGPSFAEFLTYAYIWHQGLLAALYLGAAAGALEEGRRFSHRLQGPDGRPLSEMDGHVVDIGRNYVRYLTCCSQVSELGKSLKLTSADRATNLRELFLMAARAKYVGTRCAEEIVTYVRRFIGTRGFSGEQVIERLTNEVIFGPLGPELHPLIERMHGTLALEAEVFPRKRWFLRD